MLPGACNSKGYLKAGPCRYHGECDYLPTQNEVSGYPVLRTRAFCVPTSHRKSRESLCMMSCRLALDSQVLAGLQSPVASSGQNLLWVDLQSQLTHEFPTAVMNKDAIASSSCLLACATTQHDAFHTLGVPHYPPLGFLRLQSGSFCVFPSTSSQNNSPLSGHGSALLSAGRQTYSVTALYKLGCFLTNHLP